MVCVQDLPLSMFIMKDHRSSMEVMTEVVVVVVVVVTVMMVLNVMRYD
jgi:hypothetical protein